jgi:hypothetical protein
MRIEPIEIVAGVVLLASAGAAVLIAFSLWGWP